MLMVVAVLCLVIILGAALHLAMHAVAKAGISLQNNWRALLIVAVTAVVLALIFERTATHLFLEIQAKEAPKVEPQELPTEQPKIVDSRE